MSIKKTSILFLSISIFTVFGCATPKKMSKNNVSGDHPQQLVGVWKCDLTQIKSNGELTLVIRANWTEELRHDGGITVNGVMKFVAGLDSGKVQMNGEGNWSATDKTFTSGFNKVDLEPLSDNKIVENMNFNKIKKAFKRAGTESYSIVDGEFIRFDNDSKTAECTPSI